MITLTKEWLLRTIAELEEERDAVPGAVNEDAAMSLAAMKLALASLEAEAVAYVDPIAFHNFSVYRAGETDNKRMGREWMWANPDAGLIPVYTAPPAPVSVPLAIHDEDFEKALSVLNDTLDDCGDSERGLLLALDKAGIEVRSDACRAAVLQGAEPVSNRDELTDGWVACSERMPNDKDYVWCWGRVVGWTEDDGFEAYYDATRNKWWAVTMDGEEPVRKVTHWMPMPAAPQQEV